MSDKSHVKLHAGDPFASAGREQAVFVPPIDLAEIARQFGMHRAEQYLRAMGNQVPDKADLDA